MSKIINKKIYTMNLNKQMKNMLSSKSLWNFIATPKYFSQFTVLASTLQPLKPGESPCKRFSSSSAYDVSPQSEYPASKDDLLTNYSNKNPRNLEMLRIARQPKGRWLDDSLTNYWYW